MASVTRSMPVVEVRDGLVICEIPSLTADGKGTYLARPQFLLGEFAHTQPPVVGDMIEERDDGSRVHVPHA